MLEVLIEIDRPSSHPTGKKKGTRVPRAWTSTRETHYSSRRRAFPNTDRKNRNKRPYRYRRVAAEESRVAETAKGGRSRTRVCVGPRANDSRSRKGRAEILRVRAPGTGADGLRGQKRVVTAVWEPADETTDEDAEDAVEGPAGGEERAGRSAEERA